MVKLWFAALLVAAGPALAQQPPAARPAMSPAEAGQLAAAAGFRIVGQQATNVCGAPARPRFAFVDLNGDRQPEAIVVDRNAECYGPPGDWFGVLVRDPNGQWRALLREVGRLRFESTRTRGWVDARINTDCERIWTFDGRTYIPGRSCVAERGPATAAPPAGLPAAAPPAPAPGKGLSAAERPAVFRAAGFVLKRGKWTMADDDGADCEASIEPDGVRDLNGDGVPEVIVTHSGTACYGMTGQGFYLMQRVGPTGWKRLYNSPGIPEFLKTTANGWPDVEIGGTGFCFPVNRWNGRTYVFLRNHEYDKGACARQR